MDKTFDFSGWATRNNLRCSDGLTIMKDAFKENSGKTVPLVWNHQHNEVFNVLGHALLENRDEGVYAYCTLNDTESGNTARSLIENGDISALSIYANKLKRQGGRVLHGAIKEVSLVLAGANPEAFIDQIIRHGEDADVDGDDGEAYIYTGETISLCHASDNRQAEENGEDAKENTMSEQKQEKTVAEIFDSMSDEQKDVVYFMVGQAVEAAKDDKGDEEDMKHNVFENDEMTGDVLSHSEMSEIISDAKRYGSLKDSVIAHGIDNIDYLFPEAQSLNTPPEFIKRDQSWVTKVMGSVRHTPFSRIKSMFANLTEDEARAKGYFKGNLKKEEVFGLLKRTTTPTTVYKKQKLDRDDVVDIVDFDVVAWLKSEMRMMLDEELARAVLVGDGRSASSDDKINEGNIRPIWTDDDLYTIKQLVSLTSTTTDNAKAKAFIQAAVKSRKNYKGSGSPVLFTTEDVLTDCLLMEDKNERVIYETEEKLATALRVSAIVTVPVLESLTRTVDGATHTLMGIIVNLADYNIGADKGGAVNLFDDFDIDYNAQKYLIETRCSGALIKPYSAIAIESKVAS